LRLAEDRNLAASAGESFRQREECRCAVRAARDAEPALDGTAVHPAPFHFEIVMLDARSTMYVPVQRKHLISRNARSRSTSSAVRIAQITGSRPRSWVAACAAG
jgi:hypothetical protein